MPGLSEKRWSRFRILNSDMRFCRRSWSRGILARLRKRPESKKRLLRSGFCTKKESLVSVPSSGFQSHHAGSTRGHEICGAFVRDLAIFFFPPREVFWRREKRESSASVEKSCFRYGNFRMSYCVCSMLGKEDFKFHTTYDIQHTILWVALAYNPSRSRKKQNAVFIVASWQ